MSLARTRPGTRAFCAALIWAAVGLSSLATQGQAACRQALVIALDVSGSVDEAEYVLQLAGLATALENPAVQEALFAMPDAPVWLFVFEWSSGRYQRDIVDWTALASAADLARVSAQLRLWRRAPAPESTGIGAALQYAAGVFTRGPFCWRNTLDVSGDGKNNDWPVPRDVLESGILEPVTINGLIIGQELFRGDDERAASVAELSAYYSANVIRGPGAFVEVALGYEDYANAMTRKLLRELNAPPMGALPPQTAPQRRAVMGLRRAAFGGAGQ
ncbi:MAG: DUF1194 domain-containing protein [Alphaproteobacteria bacterium]|nr:DUF1194 domain-containing protein [Alphaproteobacteria bacterium]NNF24054.1 DUF1194 domain-containing protein [Paracoccaceae bacterium]